ncbi:ATP-binding protein [Alkalihalobacillus oceani]|uniref:histidine kinase n=1 Tax=Halalkalibacter oceani TaxID=1653776 RepID=A0A9X2INY4_9BACI|nr:ATP-binding protein [Halalkalibacter oceani]MCM3714710.1 ATP-binding protein [Halalkalibacter oceani]
MKKKKIFLVISLFLVFLTCIRLLWLSFIAIPEHYYAVDGVIDFRTNALPKASTLILGGEWNFISAQLLSHQGDPLLPTRRELVPGEWTKRDTTDSFQYGTYHLQLILAEEDLYKTYGMRIPSIRSSSQVFINGQLLGSSGVPADSPSSYMASNVPYSVSFYADQPEINIFIQVAHSSLDPRPGAIQQSITFGSMEAINQESMIKTGSEITVAVIFLIHAFYAGILYLLGARQKVLIYFMLLTLAATLMIFVSDSKLFFSFFDVSYPWQIKIVFLTYTCVALFLLLFFKHLLPNFTNHWVFFAIPLLWMLYLLYILFAPLESILRFSFILLFILLIPAFVIMHQLIRTIMYNLEDCLLLLLGTVAIINNVAWASLKHRTEIEFPFYPFDLLFVIIFFSAFWFKRYFRAAEQTVKLSEELQKANQQKDEFLAATSHELRNPLHSIVMIAEHLLNSEKNLSPDSKQNVNILLKVSRRMTLLLDDLLDFTRLKNKQLKLQLSPVEVAPVVTGVLDMLRIIADGKTIHFVSQIDDRFPPVKADEHRLVQILFNLVHNAVKYTDQGTITISASVVGDYAYINVKDTGTGIDETVQTKMFNPYEQGDASSALAAEGIGLGLTICQQLVELHGGELTVISEKGQGSLFTFSLPLAGQHEADIKNRTPRPSASDEISATKVQAERLMKPSATSTAHILIVDDDPVNLRIMQNTLSSNSVIAVTARSGEEALSLLAEHNWDLIISDVMMPQMSGYELTALIRKRFTVSELPVLLLTARTRSEDIHAGFQAGANDYLAKPVDSVELKARVDTLVRIKQTTAEHLRMEAAWLQAQIQPHFLFNTLNTILALLEYDKPKMKEVFEAFIHYLQAGFDFENSKHVIPLEQELEVVRSYLFIEQVRFGHRLEIVWERDETVNVLVPPLAIQTLVENALTHGILKQINGGSVRISIIRQEDEAVITIADNGVGIPAHILEQQLSDRRPDKGGVGLYNTDRRLKQLYGQGLAIQTQLGEGTTVSFRLPLDDE